MGFADKDKHLPDHDAACISIVEDPHTIIRALTAAKAAGAPNVLLESVLTKGEGRYMTTIGFIDVVLTWDEEGKERNEPKKDERYGPSHKQFDTYDDAMAHYAKFPYHISSKSSLIEVKTTIESVGDLLRQMNLYRQHAPLYGDFVVWSLDPTDARHAKVLDSQGYVLLVGPIGAVTRPALSDLPVTKAS